MTAVRPSSFFAGRCVRNSTRSCLTRARDSSSAAWSFSSRFIPGWKSGSISAGADSAIGARLPGLFVEAGIGEPDGTDVAGRLEPLATGWQIVAGTARSVLPTAIAAGITTEETAELQLRAQAAGLTPDVYSPEGAARRHGDDRVHEPIRAWEYYVAVAEGRLTIAG